MAKIRIRKSGNGNAISGRVLRSQTTRVLRSHASRGGSAKVAKSVAAPVKRTRKRMAKGAVVDALTVDAHAKAPIMDLPAELLLKVTDRLPAADVAMFGFTNRGLHAFVQAGWQRRYGFPIPHRDARNPAMWGMVVHEKERMEAMIFGPCTSRAEVREQALPRAKRLDDSAFQMVALQSAAPEDFYDDWAAEFVTDYLVDHARYDDALTYCRNIPRPLSSKAVDVLTYVLRHRQDIALLEEVVPLLSFDRYEPFIKDALLDIANHSHRGDFTSELLDMIVERDVTDLDAPTQSALLACCNFFLPERISSLLPDVEVAAVASFLENCDGSFAKQALEAVLAMANQVHDTAALRTLLENVHDKLPELFPQHALGRLGDVWMRTCTSTWIEDHKITKAICVAGFNVNAPFADGRLPLAIAAEADDLQYVAILLEHGASPLATDSWGNAAWTFGRDNLTLALRFAEYGAPVPDNALTRWVSRGDRELKALRQIRAAGQRLTATARMDLNRTLATVVGDFPPEDWRAALELLLEMGLRGEPAADEDYHALCSVLTLGMRGNADLFALFLEYGFNVRAYDDAGRTVLHKMSISSPCLPLAAEAGACLTQRDCSGRLPFRSHGEFTWEGGTMRIDNWIEHCTAKLRAAGFAPDEVEAWARMSRHTHARFEASLR